MSKTEILQKLRANKPSAEVQIPVVDPDAATVTNPLAAFTSKVQAMGGEVVHNAEVLAARFPIEKYTIISCTDHFPGNVAIDETSRPAELEHIDLAVVQGRFGVVENGAIWIQAEDVKQRVLPFIAQHLALVLKRDHLADNMHEAYEMLDLSGTGFGVFVAGPSKTADIEQSLVIGAQGPRSLTVLLID